jgi:hypothetical protein
MACYKDLRLCSETLFTKYYLADLADLIGIYLHLSTPKDIETSPMHRRGLCETAKRLHLAE